MGIKQNPFGQADGGLIELGAIQALFEDIPASEVGCASGAQNAFDGAQVFVREMIVNQCRLAGCPPRSEGAYGYGTGDHTDECWFGKRRAYYADRNAKQ